MAGSVRELETDEEWEAGVDILRQLWDWKSKEEVHAWREQDGYRLLGYDVDGDLIGVAGVFVQVVLHHQRTFWVHDLVVDEDHRSKGHGADFLDALEARADEEECDVLALVSRPDNEGATEFYEEHMELFGHVFEREL